MVTGLMFQKQTIKRGQFGGMLPALLYNLVICFCSEGAVKVWQVSWMLPNDLKKAVVTQIYFVVVLVIFAWTTGDKYISRESVNTQIVFQ